MTHNVAVDVGGTFTDVLVFDEETGELTEGKVLSTPEDPSKGVVEGIQAVCEKVGISTLRSVELLPKRPGERLVV